MPDCAPVGIRSGVPGSAETIEPPVHAVCTSEWTPDQPVGWSIKKALGNAVARNRIRRRLREIVRMHRHEMGAGWDVVIHPRASVAEAKFEALADELVKLVPREAAPAVGAAAAKPTAGTSGGREET